MPLLYRDALHGDLPVLGTLRRCVVTAKGWCAFDDAGGVVAVEITDGSPPPEDHILSFKDGVLVGVWLIEWERRSTTLAS